VNCDIYYRNTEIAEKLRRLVEGFQFPGVPRTVTISAGVAAFPTHGMTRDELIRAADNGLYAAKQAGRNRVCLASVPHSAAAGPLTCSFFGTR